MSLEKDNKSVKKKPGARGKIVDVKREAAVNEGTVMRRQRRHDIIKAEIFNAVIDAMEKRNWSVISIDEIANEIGGSRGTIYHYFKNKNDLMSAMWLHLHRSMTGVLAPIYHDSNLGPAEKLRKFVYMYVYLMCSNWRMARVIWTNAQSIIRWDNQTSQELWAERISALIAMRKMIAAVRPQCNYPKDVLETEAKAMLAVMDSTLIWYREPCNMTPDDVAMMITTRLMSGLIPDWRRQLPENTI